MVNTGLSNHSQAILEQLCRYAFSQPEDKRASLPFFDGEEKAYRELKRYGYITNVKADNTEFYAVLTTRKFDKYCHDYAQRR